MLAKTKYVASVAFVVALLMAAFHTASALYFKEDFRDSIDTHRTRSPLTTTAPAIVLDEVHRLGRDEGPRFVVVGSSNAMYSLGSKRLEKAMPHRRVHNLSVPSSNVTAVRQVVDLVLAAGAGPPNRNTVLVLGIYSGLFAENESLHRGRPTPVLREMDRFGLYSETARGVQPRLGFGLTKKLNRTFLTAKRVEQLVARLWKKGELDKRALSTEISKLLYPWRKGTTPKWRKVAVKKRRIKQIGTRRRLAEQQFIELERLAEKVVGAGVRLIIVELPTPSWSRKAHFGYYREHKRAAVRALANKAGVDYLDLHDAVPDRLMGDDTHVLHAGADLFVSVFVKAVAKLEPPL